MLLSGRNLRIAGNSSFDCKVALLRSAAGDAPGIGLNYFSGLKTRRDQPQGGHFMNAEVAAFLDSLKTGKATETSGLERDARAGISPTNSKLLVLAAALERIVNGMNDQNR